MSLATASTFALAACGAAATATTVPAPTATKAAAASGGPSGAPAASESAAAAAAAVTGGKKLKVGLVTDVGSINDKSFNQSSYEGIVQAQKELGAEIKYIETKDAKDYSKNIDQFVQEKYDVIVTVGFAIGDATIAAAKASPDIKFIGVDQFQADTVSNLAGLVFEEDKA